MQVLPKLGPSLSQDGLSPWHWIRERLGERGSSVTNISKAKPEAAGGMLVTGVLFLSFSAEKECVAAWDEGS